MNIIDGVWGGIDGNGDAIEQPQEWADFVLMKEMGWTYDDLSKVPAYVQRFCLDFLGEVNRKRSSQD